MADITVANVENFLYEVRGPMQVNFRKQHVLHAELKRRKARNVYDGNKVRVPVLLAPMQGGGNPGESGTINVPQQLTTTKAEATLQNLVQPFAITLDAEEDSGGDNSSWAVLAMSVKEARNALAEIENDQLNNADALLATITGGSSPGLTVSVSASATQWDALYPGRVVDILTRSNGADPGQGKRRKIASFNETSGTITFETAQTASDGGSGNITFSANEGIYITGVYDTGTNRGLESIHDVASATGTFQNIIRSNVEGWKAIDGRGGDTTTKMLSDVILDGATRRGRRSGAFAWDFGIASPAVIDGYKQSKYALVRYEPEATTLKSGFRGIVYDGADKPLPLVKEDRFQRNKLVLIPLEDLAFYAPGRFTSGPDFVDDDGAMFRRFSRSLPKEAWLRDRFNLVAYRCNRVVFVGNLDEAA